MKNKMTKEEFKELFEEAVIEALEELEKDFSECMDKKGTTDVSMRMTFILQNSLTAATIKSKLFKD